MKMKALKYITLFFALLLCVESVSFAQGKKKDENKPVTIYGNVVSEKGYPLMGVLVTVQDTFIDTITDENGDFEITVPSLGSVLAFNTDYFYEYLQTINSDGFLRIVMKEAPAGLGTRENVNLPYRTAKKREVSASLWTITDEDLAKSKVTSLGNALSGRVLGMTSRQLAGAPGYDEATFVIRGIRTLDGGCSNTSSVYGDPTPLIIVDGFERNFAELNADEIESFSILKDAAATAIYGLRGANGVILVNTKHGDTNKRTIDVKYNEGMLMPTDCFPDYVDSYTYATWYNEAMVNDGLTPIYTEKDLELYQNHQSPLTHPDVNFYDELFKSFTSQRNASIAMRGGNQVARYFVLAGYTYQGGLLKYEDFNPAFSTKTNYAKYNLRSNIDINLTDWLTFTGMIAGRIEERKRPSADFTASEAGTVMNEIKNPANAYPMYFYGIDPTLNQEVLMIGGNSVYQNNPFGLITEGGYYEQTRRYYQFTGKLVADFTKFGVKGLSLEASGHLDGYNSYSVTHSRTFQVWQYSKDDTGADVYRSFKTPTSLTASGAYGVTRYYGGDVELKYDRSFGNHNVDAMLFSNWQLTQTLKNNSPDYRYHTFGFWGAYSYKNKYYVDVTAAVSGSDKFYFTNNPRQLYPAVGLSWVISGENFMSKAKLVNYLKLRATAGISGNNLYEFTDINGNDERYPARARYWTGSGYMYYGTTLATVTHVREGRVPNPDVTVEKAAMYNLALEGSMFNHRLDFDLEIWHEKRYDAYTAAKATYPNVLGSLEDRLPIGNAGIVRSQGIELSLKWSDKIGDFKYSILAIGSYNDNKILAMGEGPRDFENLVETGRRTRMDFGFKCLGFFKDWDDVHNSPEQLLGVYGPGDLKYADLNGDGVIDSNDRTAIGEGRDPRAVYAMNLNFNYKGWGVDFLLQGTGYMSNWFNTSMNAFHAFYDNGTAQYYMKDRCQLDADGNVINYDTATYPRFTTGAGNANNVTCSDFWMVSSTYLRLKNIEISYTLPDRWLKGIALDKAKVYLNAYNPLTFSYMSKYHADAEDAWAGSYRYPQTKLYSIGVDLTF